MFAPDLTLPALSHMKARFGDRLYGRYGFADAFHPTANWINPDVIGIDLGITLLSAENLRTGNVWRWFMANPEITTAMQRAGFTPAHGGISGGGRSGTIARSTSWSPLRPRRSCARPGRRARRCPRAWPIASRRRTFTAPDGVDPPLPAPAAGDAAAARHARAARAGAARLRRDRHGQPRPAHAARAGLGPRRGARPRWRVRGRAADAGANRSRTRARPTGDARTSEGTAAGAGDAGAPRLARRHAADRSAAHLASSASRWARRRPGTCCTRGRDSSPPPCRSPACRAPIRRRRCTRRRGSG